MTFSGITSSLTQSAKSLNGLVTKMGSQLQTQFGPAINSVKESLDVLKAGQDVVSTMVKDVSGQNVTIRDIQKGASDFDKKWDAFAKEVNEKFNTAPAGSQADVMETFARSHFGDDIYNLGSAIKNQLPGVLDGVADYQEAVNNMRSDSKKAEEAAGKIQSGVEKMIKATEKVAQSLNDTVEICTGNGLPILDELSNIGSSASVANLNKVLSLGVSGATVATAGSQLKESLKNKDLRGVTDALAKDATSVNSLLKDLSNLVPGFPNAQIPVQITNSIKRLKDGKNVYDAAGAMLTALVADASGPTTVASLAGLTTHFNQNWDTFSSKIDALFQLTPSSGQQAVLETVAKSLFGDKVFYASGAIKRQLPGVLSGVADVQDAIKQFGGSYRNPIEAATKIRNGVEKMVQAVEKISQSLNNMIKHYQGRGDITKGTGLPLLDALGNIGDSKGIKALDTALRIGGGTAAVVGNAGAVAQAIKNRDIPGAIAAVKKTIDDVKKLTKKGNYKANGNQEAVTGLPRNSSKTSNSDNNTSQQSLKNKNDLPSASTDSYVCSGAMMKCSMGTSPARLTVLPTRTVFLTGQPMANISDHLSMVNLAPFGRCRSMGFPATASATAANHGTLTPMPCVHNTPFPWMGGKNDYIIKGNPALLKSSTCQCLWGGTISLVTDGQTPVSSIDLSRKPIVTFDKIQKKNCHHTVIIPQFPAIGYQERKLIEDHRTRKLQKHALELIAKLDKLGTKTIDCFWTQGGSNYLNDLKNEILKTRPDLTINILEGTQLGKDMMGRVNKRLERYCRERGIIISKYGLDYEDLYKNDEVSWGKKGRLWNAIKEKEDFDRNTVIDKYKHWPEGTAHKMRNSKDKEEREKNERELKEIWGEIRDSDKSSVFFHTIADIRDRYQKYISSVYAKKAAKNELSMIVVVKGTGSNNPDSIWNTVESEIIKDIRGDKQWIEINEV